MPSAIAAEAAAILTALQSFAFHLQGSSPMSEPITACPKCNGPMVQGFIIDNTHGGMMPSSWGSGEPQKSFWFGTKTPSETIGFGTFRCSSCGSLESYAREEYARR